MTVGLRLMAVTCFIVGLGLGWYGGQQVDLARTLRATLDEALLRGQVADWDASISHQMADELRGGADILAASDMTTVVLEGQPGAENTEGRVFLSASRGSVIAISNMPPLPPGQTYQVWFVLLSGPVSVGVAHVGATGRMFQSIESSPDATRVIAVAVTREPEGGVEMPSGNLLLLGRTDR